MFCISRGRYVFVSPDKNEKRETNRIKLTHFRSRIGEELKLSSLQEMSPLKDFPYCNVAHRILSHFENEKQKIINKDCHKIQFLPIYSPQLSEQDRKILLSYDPLLGVDINMGPDTKLFRLTYKKYIINDKIIGHSDCRRGKLKNFLIASEKPFYKNAKEILTSLEKQGDVLMDISHKYWRKKEGRYGPTDMYVSTLGVNVLNVFAGPIAMESTKVYLGEKGCLGKDQVIIEIRLGDALKQGEMIFEDVGSCAGDDESCYPFFLTICKPIPVKVYDSCTQL